MVTQRVVVVGAGLGGLAAAARLARQGFDVEVIERRDGPGGRCGRVTLGQFQFDLGPTLLLMPEVLEETFAACGSDVRRELELIRCDPNYRVHFHDRSAISFTTDLVKMGEALEQMEPGSKQAYLSFLAMGRDQYRTSLDRFVGRNFDSALPFFSPGNLRHVFRIRAHKKMYAEVSRYFRDPRLRAALTFQTMYLGISPYESPAVYGLLPYAELGLGIWFPKGGMYAIPKAMERLCRSLGVRFRYGATVEEIAIDGGGAKGVRLAGGEKVSADAVLCNADLPWAYRNLIDPKHTQLPRAKSLKYTSSAYMMYWGLSKRVDSLEHHNVYLGSDYQGSFEDIFDRGRVPADPSFYVNAPAHTDPSLAPAGKDSLYVLVPVPHQGAGLDWAKEGPAIRRKVLARLAAEGHGDLAPLIEAERHVGPNDWAGSLNLEHGSAFGLSHHFFQVGPFRPDNQDPNVRNLFFVGASTRPGTGIPMVLLSARLVTERMAAQRGAPPRWREPVRLREAA